MQGNANDMKTKGAVITSKKQGGFIAARDGTGKKKIPNLFVRNGNYYFRQRVEVEGKPKSMRVRLELDGRPLRCIEDLPEAKRQVAIKLAEKALNKGKGSGFMTPELTPLFDDACAKYLSYHETTILRDEANRKAGGIKDKAPKKRATWKKEKAELKAWGKFLGNIRLEKIGSHDVTKFLRKLELDEKSPRTQKLYLQTLRNLLNFHRKVAGPTSPLKKNQLPTADVKITMEKAEQDATDLKIIEFADLNRFVEKALATGPNGQALADFIKLLAFSGARELEGLRLRWADVDFDTKWLTIGSDRLTKNRNSRMVKFSEDLETHLKDMHARKAPDSEWLFPSPKRGSNANHKYWANPHKPWEAARKAAGLPNITRHSLRHYFASNAVMSGIDTMLISKWLGHRDGGKLVETLYGNKITESHHALMAAKLTLSGPRIVALPTPEPATETAAATA